MGRFSPRARTARKPGSRARPWRMSLVKAGLSEAQERSGRRSVERMYGLDRIRRQRRRQSLFRSSVMGGIVRIAAQLHVALDLFRCQQRLLLQVREQMRAAYLRLPVRDVSQRLI